MKPIFWICTLSLLAILSPVIGSAQTYNLDWGSSFVPAWGDGNISGFAPNVAPGVDVSVTIYNTKPASWTNITGSVKAPAVSPTNSRSGFFYMNSSYTTSLMELDADWTSASADYLTVEYVFSQPVYDVSFYVGDIDKFDPNDPRYIDQVSFSAYNSLVGPGFINVSSFTIMQPKTPAWLLTVLNPGNNKVYANTASGKGGGGNAGTTSNSTQEGTVRVQYATGITRLVMKYNNYYVVPGQPSNPSLQAIAISNLRFNVPVINGTVWHDANNSANNTFSNIKTGSEAGTNAGGLYVNLVNGAGTVLSSVPVASNGTYSIAFPESTPNLQLQLSTNPGTVGSPMPASQVPAGWAATSPLLTPAFTSDGSGADLNGRDFGVNQLPQTAVTTQASVTNPGGYNFYTIPASAFQNGTQTRDYATGTVTQMRITSFPTNTNYIQIGSTIYRNGGACAPSTTCSPWPAGGVTISYTNNTGPVPAIAIDPVDGNVTAVISFAAIDNGGGEDPTPGSVSQPFTQPLISISGYLFNDFDGSQILNGSEKRVSGTTGTSGGSITTGVAIYAVLSNASGSVIDIKQLAADGSYTFTSAPGNTSNLSIRATTSYATVGSATPAITLPAGWAVTGEYSTNAIDPVQDGIIVLNTGTANSTNQLFGWERLPVADAKSYNITTPAVNAYITLNGTGSQPGVLTGTDAEDGAQGAGKKLAITALPTNGNQVFYNSIQVTTGQDGINPPSVSNPFIINSYTASLLQVRAVGLGSTGISFDYAWIDNASKQGLSVSYNITWAFLLPVNITAFTARAEAASTLLNWSAENQERFDRYEVEYSTDSRSYTKVGEVKAIAASSGDYQFRHYLKANSAAKLYYRLKMIDIDGHYLYSETVLVKFNQSGVAIWPTLLHAGETLYVQPGSGLQANATLEIMDSNGRLVLSQKTNNQQVVSVQTGQWTSGVYIVRVQSGGEQTVSKIVIRP